MWTEKLRFILRRMSDGNLKEISFELAEAIRTEPDAKPPLTLAQSIERALILYSIGGSLDADEAGVKFQQKILDVTSST